MKVVVEREQSNQASLNQFAACVGSKATLSLSAVKCVYENSRPSQNKQYYLIIDSFMILIVRQYEVLILRRQCSRRLFPIAPTLSVGVVAKSSARPETLKTENGGKIRNSPFVSRPSPRTPAGRCKGVHLGYTTLGFCFSNTVTIMYQVHLAGRLFKIKIRHRK